ncbi:MAG: FAD-dependent oxidoreductase [Thermoplasmata archaeon]|nr:FAD-dependent oxidoreductase [Thermoplasmata archaeon]
MVEERHVEVLVLGAGEAGKYIAWTLAQSGRRTVVVEREYIGGSCPNVSCLPSKNEIHGAKVAEISRDSPRFGVHAQAVSVNMTEVRERKRRMVNDEVAFHLQRFKDTGVELILGEGHFVAPRTLEVRLNPTGTLRVSGDRVFIDVGTHATIPKLPGLNESRPLTHVQALELDRVPEHLLVLGGGSVALELAHAFRRFGAQITVIARSPRLLAREDPSVGEEFLRMFQQDGIEVILGAQLERVQGTSGSGVSVRFGVDGAARTVEGSDLLVAMGRTPNTFNIGLDTAGVELDGRGFIQVNDRLETTAPETWAMGECAGSPQFTHVAFDDFRVVSGNLSGEHRSTRSRLIPFCLFTDPEYVRVGLGETDARAQGLDYRVFQLPMTAVLRTHTLSAPRGFLKGLVAADSDRILGFMAMGAEASELLAAMQTAMIGGLPYTSIRDGIFAHPTVSEGLVFLFRGQPVHKSGKPGGVGAERSVSPP